MIRNYGLGNNCKICARSRRSYAQMRGTAPTTCIIIGLHGNILTKAFNDIVDADDMVNFSAVVRRLYLC